MILLALALLQHVHTEQPDLRVDLRDRRQTLVELPSKGYHQHIIDVDTLAKSTIAYCERMKLTRCDNEVSAMSGGAKITVRKVRGKWVAGKR